jgi:hypothetical protein
LLLLSFVPQVTNNDVWIWVSDPVAGYTVKGAYHSLLNELIVMPSAFPAVLPSIWRKDVPLKVSVFAWRLFRDRLPTKDNLSRRSIIHEDARGCVSGCGLPETAYHLFLHCVVFGHVWYLVRHWLGISSVNPLTISEHYLQFRTSSGSAISRCSFMQLLWFATIWVIWKERNARIYRAKESTMHQLLDNIKLLSFSWFKASSVAFYYKFHDWSQNPFCCLGNG